MTESFNSAESAAEGAALGVWLFQEMRAVCIFFGLPMVGSMVLKRKLYKYKSVICSKGEEASTNTEYRIVRFLRLHRLADRSAESFRAESRQTVSGNTVQHFDAYRVR